MFNKLRRVSKEIIYIVGNDKIVILKGTKKISKKFYN